MPERMRETEAFATKDMAAAAQDATPDLATTAGVLEHAFGLPADGISSADRQQVCSCPRTMASGILHAYAAAVLFASSSHSGLLPICNPKHPSGSEVPFSVYAAWATTSTHMLRPILGIEFPNRRIMAASTS